MCKSAPTARFHFSVMKLYIGRYKVTAVNGGSSEHCLSEWPVQTNVECGLGLSFVMHMYAACSK